MRINFAIRLIISSPWLWGKSKVRIIFLMSNYPICTHHFTYLWGRRSAFVRLMKRSGCFRNTNYATRIVLFFVRKKWNSRQNSMRTSPAYDCRLHIFVLLFRFFKIVGAHPASSRVIEAEVLWTLERRVAALERQLREYEEASCAVPSLALRELKRQVDSFKNKFENNEQLSWLSK